MRLNVLATDYDGTIASDGYVCEETVRALERARAAGVKLVLVSGRTLDDLAARFELLDLFERVVAENGAVVHDPARGTTTLLAEAPPAAFLEALARYGVPVSRGFTIVATDKSYEMQLLQTIDDLGLAWHVVANRSALTALPVSVTKATGLLQALNDIGVTADCTVGIGDAENDVAFLRVCGFAAAVANCLPCVQEVADIVTQRARGEGVAELIDRWLAGELHGSVAPADRRDQAHVVRSRTKH